ncbi:FecR domain-containing protein [Pseudoalteromonas sp. D15MCD-2]|uniref:FecR family protein n=1 Tax=Pseudoalteromonas sp. D15MCD-2 TaxID=3138933 RepID=UPI0031599322
MDRQQALLQEQANKWLEQQKCGFTTEQEEQFQYWLSLNPDHKTIFEESKQIDGLLAQFSEQEIENLSTSKVFRFSQANVWMATAACLAIFMISLISFTLLPHTESSDYSAQYSSAVGEQLEVNLPEGSKLYLDAQTNLNINFNEHIRSNTLVKGRALFDVTTNPKRPFIVNTDTTKITVLGTRFTVDKKPLNTRIRVSHGRVKVQSNQHTVELIQGQQAYVNEQGISVENINPTLIDAWQHGRLIFDNTPLNEVFVEFNRYHDREFKFASNELSQLPLSGTFNASELDNFLKLLPHVVPVEVKTEKDQIIINKL